MSYKLGFSKKKKYYNSMLWYKDMTNRFWNLVNYEKVIKRKYILVVICI